MAFVSEQALALASLSRIGSSINRGKTGIIFDCSDPSHDRSYVLHFKVDVLDFQYGQNGRPEVRARVCRAHGAGGEMIGVKRDNHQYAETRRYQT